MLKHPLARRAVLIGTLLALPAQAQAFDLTGAWASNAEQCSKVFKKTGDQITFTKESEVYGSGFIASANELRGRTAKCTIKSKKETGDTLNILGACSTDIMLQSVQFSLKVMDADKVSRQFPGMEGMEISFYRCAL
jgi:hypothetical protein